MRPLRPGPRINLASRGRGASTTTTTEAAAEDRVTGDDEPIVEEKEASEKVIKTNRTYNLIIKNFELFQEETLAPVDNSPLGRLRNKQRLTVQPSKPKAAASAPVQVRRVNPLLGRRRPGQTTEAPASSETPPVEVTEAEAEEAETEPSAQPSSTTTTEEPRGLNKLLAGRRKLGARTPGTLSHKSS